MGLLHCGGIEQRTALFVHKLFDFNTITSVTLLTFNTITSVTLTNNLRILDSNQLILKWYLLSHN